jgi:hypothetical protein
MSPLQAQEELSGTTTGEPLMQRKHRLTTARHRLAAAQFDLFAPPSVTQPSLQLEWQHLPEDTREAVTKLMVRLLLEHGRGDRRKRGRGDV